MNATTPETSRVAIARVESRWVHAGHVLHLVEDVDLQQPAYRRRDPARLWVVYYRARPLARFPLGASPWERAEGIQILAADAVREEAVRRAETAVDAGAADEPPDADQALAIAEGLDREANIAGFVSPEISQLDVVPYQHDPTRPPLPPDGLQIGRDDTGTWRTYQERYPTSTLTSGHASNVEAYWACHALRGLAPWALVVDVRAPDEVAPARCEAERDLLAHGVDRVDERYREWRTGSEKDREPDQTREVRGAEGLRLERSGSRTWWVCTTDGVVLASSISSQAKASQAARALAALADWTSLPRYALEHLPALCQDIAAVEHEARNHPDWAEEARQRAQRIRTASRAVSR